MSARQGILFIACLPLLFGLSACQPSIESIPTQAVSPSTPTATATLTPIPVPASPMPVNCRTLPGILKQDVVPTTKPPQEFIIYLPPCYEESANEHFPVLYLLHGQTYTQDQWVRLGVPSVADQYIQQGASPFIIVFPDDRYWNVPAGAGFGDRFINALIPYVDSNYRTLTDREYRYLGGLSRGGGWAVKLGFEHTDLFGALGLHSPAIFKDNAPYLDRIIKDTTEEDRPQLWLDIGDADKELSSAVLFEEILTQNDYIHEFHLFSGDHTEAYWGAHVDEYLLWYIQQWQKETSEQ
jgi:enterochelin esterase-like enzyme